MIGFLYLPEFAAWAIRQQTKSNKPTAVHAKGRIVARSTDLREILALGMTLQQAQTLYPDALFVAYDPLLEAQAWQQLIQKVYAITPFILPEQPGCLFFRYLTTAEAHDLADQLGAKIGRAETPHAARFAALKTIEGGVMDIMPGFESAFLQQIPSTALDVWVPAEKGSAKLVAQGFQSIGEILQWTEAAWKHSLGKTGSMLFKRLNHKHLEKELHNYLPPVTIRRVANLHPTVSDAATMQTYLVFFAKHLLYDLDGMETPRLSLVLHAEEGTFMECGRAMKGIPLEMDALIQSLNTLILPELTKMKGLRRIECTLSGFAPTPFVVSPTEPAPTPALPLQLASNNLVRLSPRPSPSLAIAG